MNYSWQTHTNKPYEMVKIYRTTKIFKYFVIHLCRIIIKKYFNVYIFLQKIMLDKRCTLNLRTLSVLDFLSQVDINSLLTTWKPLVATEARGRSVDIDGEPPSLTMVEITVQVSARGRRQTSPLVMVQAAERGSVWTPPVCLWLPALAEPLTGLETGLPPGH